MNVQCDDLSMSYRTKNRAPRKVFSHFSLNIGAGELVGIIGPEGAGKSTLLQLVDGLHRPEGGHVSVGGRDLWEDPSAAAEIRRSIAYAFQFPEQQFFCETVAEELEFKLRNAGEPSPDDTREILRRVGLEPDVFLPRSPFSLSMGEARRVALASVLVGEPALLLLDEPTAGLDGKGMHDVLSILAHEFDGRTVLIVSHDVDLLSDCADRIIVMSGGQVIDDGPVGGLFSDRTKMESFGYHLPEGMQLVEELRRAGIALPSDFYRNRDVETLLRSDPSFVKVLRQ